MDNPPPEKVVEEVKPEGEGEGEEEEKKEEQPEEAEGEQAEEEKEEQPEEEENSQEAIILDQKRHPLSIPDLLQSIDPEAYLLLSKSNIFFFRFEEILMSIYPQIAGVRRRNLSTK